MMQKTYYLVIIIFLTLLSCNKNPGLIEDLMVKSGKFDPILKNAEKHRLQIIYTQIDRDENNKASFKTFKYRVNPDNYFYPASSIKLPMAALALEKINNQKVDGFSPFSTMQIDSAYSGQTSVREDSSSHEGKPSIGHYIKKLFLVSDNDAFNRLYEFVGQQEANASMIKKGFQDIRITHRLSIPLSLEENRCTNPMRFYFNDTMVYDQDLVCNPNKIKSDSAIFLGKGYMKDGQLVNEPMDFTYKNAIGLQSLHDVLLSIMFPENFYPANKFNLHKTDYEFLYQFMSKYPGESDFPYYGGKYKDDYCKFLMFAGTNQNIDRNIRIYNKIGEAYGFLIDMAYIIDFEKQIEFVLGAVIYVNENEMLNDGNYEYETVGYRFMRDLGQVFYTYELNRPRAHKPDLSGYNWKLWTE
jgi:hypothetical protein